jgi:hypothetical protein
MTIRQAANNTTTGGISASAASAGGSSGLTEAQVTTLANTAIADKSEYFLKRTFSFAGDKSEIAEHNIDVDTYPRLKFRIYNIHNKSGSYYYVQPTNNGTADTSLYNTGHYYRDSTPGGWNATNEPRPSQNNTTYTDGQSGRSEWVFEFTFSRSTDTNQQVQVWYSCGVQQFGGYQGYAHTGRFMMSDSGSTGGTHFNGVRLVPNSGDWGKDGTTTDDCRVEVYQGKYITPTSE